MNTLIKTMVVGGALLASSFSFAQTKEEHHTKLTEYHTKGKEYAAKIKTGESTTKETHKMNAMEAGKHLDNAKAKHAELKASMPENYKAVAKPHHEVIEKHHMEAKKHHESLNAELAKDKHDEIMVKKHATNFHSSLDNAEMEHQKLKAKTSK